MVKLQENNNQYFATIPNELRKAMGWEKGDELRFSVKDDSTLEVEKE